MESRVDMYLDRRFDLLMEEYSLITKPKLRKYRAEKEPALLEEEGRIEDLKRFKGEMTETLADMEKRLDVLEKESKTD
jgi:hypothetical protein